ncbi:RCC1 domain-containing protein [Cohnella panacarvi]|uniref:RCC1 domain-containing protein n=1 Tax=Cohnella panacarvi TaxID=400776 RepID=UPI00047E6C45|nr:hypothetical protein [Cohnella panacarvi]
MNTVGKMKKIALGVKLALCAVLGAGAVVWNAGTPREAAAEGSDIHAVEAGYKSSFALRDGKLLVWGDNESGRLGLRERSTYFETRPVVNELVNVVSVETNGSTTLAVKANGDLLGFGKNHEGLLGLRVNPFDVRIVESSAIPIIVPINNVRSVALGGGVAIALKKDGTAWEWGYNSGLARDKYHIPRQLSGLPSNIDTIFAEGDSFFATTADGKVYVWGSNHSGQLGLDTADKSQPTPIRNYNLTGFKSFRGAQMATIGLKADGTVWIWGDKNACSNDSNYNSKLEQIPGLTGITEIDASYSFLALNKAGKVYSFGCNINNYQWESPKQVQGLPSDIIDIAKGWSHGLAMSADGALWGWGINNRGSVGDGTVTDRPIPVRVDDDHPIRPENLRAFPGESKITLVWANYNPDIQYYNVYRKSNMETNYRVVPTNGNENFLIVSGTYFFKYSFYVTAVDKAGHESQPTPVIEARPLVNR